MVADSTLIGNLSVARRGLWFSYTTMTVYNTIFTDFYEDNLIGLVGAGMYSLSSNTYIANSQFSNNVATNGAGIYFDCSDATSCSYMI